MKIGVFGGTFNPPHLGHLQAAEAARTALGLDRILLVPAAQPPHKQIPDGSPTGEQRLEMLQIAAEGYPGMEVSDIELRREGSSYTADTLETLHSMMPEAELYLITGTDMFLTLHEWYRPEKICELAVIAGLSREKGREETLAQQAEYLKQTFGARTVLVPNPVLEVSSTTVRRLLILGGAEDYLPQGLAEYIRRKGLYGSGRDYRGLPMEELRRVALALLKKKRVRHVEGVAETAEKLAVRYGADPVTACRAGLLHDVTKALDGPDQLRLVRKYGILISDFERKYPKLLHAKTGAAAARIVFGESDAVVEAVKWHTTGKADMSLMEKIVYLADYIEPSRDFPGVDTLRAAVWEDLDKGLLMGFEFCLAELEREKKPICTDSIAALEYMRQTAEHAEE